MSQDQKRELIIETAIRRFAHYGVSKTTMNEIAKDLSFSKALLYYYFPDKMHLVGAILEHISEQNMVEYRRISEKTTDPREAMLLFLEKRTDFIIRYYNIIEFVLEFKNDKYPPELMTIFVNLKKKELEHITTIIESGKQQGLFKIDHPKKISEMYLDFLIGYRKYYGIMHSNPIPDKKQFLAILKKEKEFSVIFLNGLTCSPD
jgi:TetR/AcrR family transcriptional repressor of mexJK operon